MIKASKAWFDAQTIAVKKLTVWLLFFTALFGIWGTLKALGVEGIDFVIGCSSYATKTEVHDKRLDKLERQMIHRKNFDSLSTLTVDSLKGQVHEINEFINQNFIVK